MNSNMKRIIASFLLVILAFIVQTCIFPLLPFLAVYPNLMVILVFSFGFIRGSAWGMGYGLIAGLLMDLSSGGPLGFHTLIFIWMGYVNGICTKYYYEDYITLPLVLSALNEVFYNFYLYLFGFLVRGRLTFRLLFHQHYPAGDDLHRGDNTDPVPAVPVYQPQTGRDGKKERHNDCLTIFLRS